MDTIKSNKSIDLIFKKGNKLSLPYLNIVIYKDKNDEIKGNVAFIAGKKNGNAVWRNKAKRILREVYKKIKINKNIKLLLLANKLTTETEINLIIEGLQGIVDEKNNN